MNRIEQATRLHAEIITGYEYLVVVQRARLHWWGRILYPRWFIAALNRAIARNVHALNDLFVETWEERHA